MSHFVLIDPPPSEAVFPPDPYNSDSKILVLCDLDAFLKIICFQTVTDVLVRW